MTPPGTRDIRADADASEVKVPVGPDHVAGVGPGRPRGGPTGAAGTGSGGMPRGVAVAVLIAAVGAGLAACGSSMSAAAPPGGAAAGSPATASTSSPATTYGPYSVYFSEAVKLTPLLDPEVFVVSAGSPAGTGPEGIAHAAGVTPAPVLSAAGTPLVAADGTPLDITVAEWNKASGLLRLSCVHGEQQAASRLTGLIPGGSYSVFLALPGPTGGSRLTPWGDAAGTTNNFTAAADGSATPTTSIPGCLTRSDAAAVVIWHSDGQPHGATPGVLGVTAHTSLLATLAPGS